jgi:hypothetical protein
VELKFLHRVPSKWLAGVALGPEASLATTIVLAAGSAYLIAKGALKAASKAQLKTV